MNTSPLKTFWQGNPPRRSRRAGEDRPVHLGRKRNRRRSYIERHGHVDHLYTPDGGDYDHFTTYIYDRSVYEDRIDTTDPAHIAAGGSLSLEAGRAVNDRSVMTAGKTLTIHGADIENRDEKDIKQ